jgi:outer membrane protein assembly factor BamB
MIAKATTVLSVLLLTAVTPALPRSAGPGRQQSPAATTATANWPGFRGHGASGIADGPELPATFSGVDGTNLAWKTEIPGMAHASPIVWEDRVYVTSAVSEAPPQRFLAELPDTGESVVDPMSHRWILMALDKATGEVLWERTAAEGVPVGGRLRKGSFNNSTPVTDGAHIVALFGSQGLFCFDRAGELLWKVDLGVLDAGWFFDPTAQWGSASSPVIWDGKVIVQVDVHGGSFIVALDLLSGEELWRTARDEVSSWATPTVVETAAGAEIVTNGGRAIRAYDPGTGEELWSLTPSSEIAVPTPILAQGLVFVGSGYLPARPFYAIRPGGRGDLTMGGDRRAGGSVVWSVTDAGPLISTPIVVGDYLYLLSRDGTVHCFDAGTGIPIFAEKIVPADAAESTFGSAPAAASEAAAAAAGGAPRTVSPATYSASPVASNGNLYFVSDTGIVHTVRAGPFLRVDASQPVGEAVFATPAISAGMLIVRGQRHLLAFSR